MTSRNAHTHAHKHTHTHALLYDVYTDGFIPHDGVPNVEEVTVSHAVTVLFVLLATIGIVFSIACLSFSVVFRKKRCRT